MIRCLLSLLGWLLLLLPAGAETMLGNLQVIFQTEPSHLEVYRINGDSRDYLGRSGELIELPPAESGTRLRIVFGYKGFLDKELLLNVDTLAESQSFPTPPRVVPLPAPQRALHFLLEEKWGGVLLGLAVLGFWWRRRSRARTRQQRLDSWTDREAQAGDPWIGKAIGGYHLASRLGAGGMATVYRALPREKLIGGANPEQLAGESVAMKLIRGDVQNADRFLREVKIALQARHPNLMQVFDWGEQDGQFYLVCELLQGQTLKDHLDGPLPFEKAARIVQQTAGALMALHERGIVHRDLKPANLFVLENGTVKLMDFGIATGSDFTKLTATGAALGTPAYMAPEQLCEKPEPASDQYALGVLAFELLTGRLPFEDSDVVKLALHHLQTPVPSLRKLRPEVPLAAEAAVTRMLDKEAALRYPDVMAAAEALSHALLSPRENG